MKVTTINLQKGGTGKTTVAMSTAVELASKGKRVLTIDIDPQGNATSWILNDDIEIQYELADVLMEKCSAEQAIVQTPIENLSIIPTASLGGSLRLYQKTLATEQPYAIRHLVKELKDEFDYCIIDTAPAFGALEESCFLASDEALAVLNIDEFSKDGLIIFLENLNKMKKRYDSDLPVINKLILNSRDLRLTQQDDIIKEIKESTDCELYIIPVDQAFKKAQSIHAPVQYLQGTKKETLNVISNIAEAVM
ncbi:ParA family protein [Treponema peruense]|uniref:ParA family protein n=1 Tax=Treponema peruense TaxID=2787628 RepID=A0A7T3V625_9SPIR|nr:ParA family protein [Treponema peruense]QQA01719.1 ParA family protein [Treponema peruense]